MRWPSWPRRGRPDRLASLKAAPEPDAARAIAQAWQEQDKIDALRTGAQVLLQTASVSYGSRGYSLRSLELAGLMASRPVVCVDHGPAALYTPTDLGLARLANLGDQEASGPWDRDQA